MIVHVSGCVFVGAFEGEGHLGGHRFVPSELPIGVILDAFGTMGLCSSRDRIVKCGADAWVKVDGEVGDDKKVGWLFFGIDGGCSALKAEEALRVIRGSGVTPIVSPVGEFGGAFRPFTVPARYVSPWWQG